MDPKEAWENRDKFTFVDVREDREWMSKGVLGVDKLYLVERGVLERELPKCVPDTSTPLMVYCAGAMRSVLATRSLNELGYTDVTSLNGGFDGWKEENLPLKSYDEWRACQDGKDE
ncbi:hypothetical protein PTSG_00149 [Salpingoeca rosetta]|uniref:Rhodanese domain-containing protein n=1 Tax=Salpingoeca rosetta (strain ATCC 50818 / BSB-021) TaxID=946362 RepID=F2TVN3_SALR5|nr:uncharacterized protein PTSG_00149 [Salpingoeca rosetta]EGD72129.1 hypothetical protein PTSG_00149 [Salpingoeca rosetta]|eukprot:XP_004998701.1 hypothetical protein PTSG_00149 [Salpingoeca rosetta]